MQLQDRIQRCWAATTQGQPTHQSGAGIIVDHFHIRDAPEEISRDVFSSSGEDIREGKLDAFPDPSQRASQTDVLTLSQEPQCESQD